MGQACGSGSQAVPPSLPSAMRPQFTGSTPAERKKNTEASGDVIYNEFEVDLSCSQTIPMIPTQVDWPTVLKDKAGEKTMTSMTWVGWPKLPGCIGHHAMTNGRVIQINYTTIDIANGVIRMWWKYPNWETPKEYRAGKVEESISVSPLPGSPDKCIFHWVVKVYPSDDPKEANMDRVKEQLAEWKEYYGHFAGNLHKWVKSQYTKVSKESVFVKRPLIGKAAHGVVGHLEMTAMMMATQPDMFKMNKDNIVEKRAMIEAYVAPQMAKFQKSYDAYAALCDEETIQIPVEDGKYQMDMIIVRPKELKKSGNSAYVFAHGGGACTLTAKLCLPECHRYAVDWQCICVTVDYRKGPEVQAPRNQLDFCEGLDHVAANATSMGIDPAKICMGGLSGGGWICMGACVQYIKMGKPNPAKCQFLITPMVYEALPHTPADQWEEWEKVYKDVKYVFYDMLTDNIEDKQQDPEVYPGRAPLEMYKQFPPAVIFTSEFDTLKRDCEKIAELYKKAGKFLDYQCMPGVHHGYQMMGELDEASWFYHEAAFAWKKYVEGE